MSQLFEIEVDHIAGLEDIQLTRLLRHLLVSEAEKFAIYPSTVDVADNIKCADGGEDGRIQWHDGPDRTDFLSSRFIQFQCKATSSMGPTACANELVGSDGKLKPMIESALAAGATYNLFTTKKLTSQQQDKRVDSIRQKLRELDKEYAETISIEIYGAEKITDWVNKYLPAVVKVASWVGRPIIPGMQTWGEWSRKRNFQKFEFCPDHTRVDHVKIIRQTLNTPGKHIRIIGLSGLGKTRLALEAFRPEADLDLLTSQVVYVDAANGISNLAGHVCDWVRQNLKAILIVDNCNLSLHKQLTEQITPQDSQISLLTLDHNLDHTSESPEIQLEKLADEQIKQMLEPVYKDRISDLSRIVNFAKGFPQMAVLLAEARLCDDGATDMGSLTDDDILQKMLWGTSGAESRDDLKVITCCALFATFGITDRGEEELEFISKELIGLDIDTVFQIIQSFAERGVVDIRGRYGQIVPTPLAVRLTADWWRTTRRSKTEEFIQQDMPGRLADNFCARIATLDFMQETKNLVRDLCGEQGPFGKAEVILSERGSRLFRYLVEVNPVATCDALTRIFLDLDDTFLRENVSGDLRRNLVVALEKLCFRKEAFEPAITILLRLAVTENESWSNNASGIFLRLFKTYLSGTEAPPDARLKIISLALDSQDESYQNLAVQALGKALETSHFTRTGGVEAQGGGKPLEDWHPKVWSEVFSYWQAALEHLTTLVIEDSSLAKQAKDIIASKLRGLIQKGRIVELDNAITTIAKAEGSCWPEALNAIKDTLRYGKKDLSEKNQEKIKGWLDLLQPSELREKLIMVVDNPHFEQEEDEDGHFIDISSNNAQKLAYELAADPSDFLEIFEVVLVGEQRQGFFFGYSFAQKCTDLQTVITRCISVLETIQDGNPAVLAGLLKHLCDIDSEQYHCFIKDISHNPLLAHHFVNITRHSPLTFQVLERAIELIKEEVLTFNQWRAYSTGVALKYLSSDEEQQVIGQLLAMQPDGSWIALDMVSIYCHGNKKDWLDHKDLFEKILLNISLGDIPTHGQIDGYHWEQAVLKLLEGNNVSFARIVAKQVFDFLINRDHYDQHYQKKVLSFLLEHFLDEVWPILIGRVEQAKSFEKYLLADIFAKSMRPEGKESVLLQLPATLLLDWCNAKPEFAPKFVAQATSTVIKDGNNWVLHPLTLELINTFNEDKSVLDAIRMSLGSFSWTGSLVPYYQRQLDAFLPLKDHSSQNVKKWALKYIGYLQEQVEKNKLQDAEHELGIW